MKGFIMDTKTISFESMFEDQFNLSPNNAINEFRTEVNPYQTFEEYSAEFIFDEELPREKQEEIFEAYEAWMERAQVALDGYQQTLMEKHTERDVWAELDLSPEFKKDKLSNYKVKTTLSLDINKNDEEKLTSRDVWDRTSGYETSTIVLTEYGSFNPATTSKAHAAWMRIRRVLRHDVEWITFGSIQINLSNGEFYCGAHRCKYEGQLHEGSDTERMEYEILALLAHLGDHAPKGDMAYPYIPILNIKQFRDEDDYKVFTHLMKCRNKSCNHTNMVLGDW